MNFIKLTPREENNNSFLRVSISCSEDLSHLFSSPPPSFHVIDIFLYWIDWPRENSRETRSLFITITIYGFREYFLTRWKKIPADYSRSNDQLSNSRFLRSVALMHHEYNMPIIEIEAIRSSLLIHGRRRINETTWIDTILVSTKKKKYQNVRRLIFHRINFTINVTYFFFCPEFDNSRNWWMKLRVWVYLKSQSNIHSWKIFLEAKLSKFYSLNSCFFFQIGSNALN